MLTATNRRTSWMSAVVGATLLTLATGCIQPFRRPAPDTVVITRTVTDTIRTTVTRRDTIRVLSPPIVRTDTVTLFGGTEFAWPPPRPTSRTEVRRQLVMRNGEPLDSAFLRIRAAIVRAGFPNYAVYSIDSTGFVVVATLEVYRDGGAAEIGPSRWRGELDAPLASWSVGGYIDALLGRREGRYRVIVLAVTHHSDASTDAVPALPTMRAMAVAGASRPTEVVRNFRASPETRCVSLVYEFVRPPGAQEPKFVELGTLSAERHLIGARLWTARELATPTSGSRRTLFGDVK
jgi:hypothetical protein